MGRIESKPNDKIRLVGRSPNVRFGSLADLFTNSSLMSGFGWKAVIAEIFTDGPEGSIFPLTFEFATPRFAYALPREEF